MELIVKPQIDQTTIASLGETRVVNINDVKIYQGKRFPINCILLVLLTQTVNWFPFQQIHRRSGSFFCDMIKAIRAVLKVVFSIPVPVFNEDTWVDVGFMNIVSELWVNRSVHLQPLNTKYKFVLTAIDLQKNAIKSYTCTESIGFHSSVSIHEASPPTEEMHVSAAYSA